MNKGIWAGLAAIAFVAAIMGFSAIAPTLPAAEASHSCNDCLIVSNIGSSGDAAVDPTIKNAQCTVTYDKKGRIVSKTHTSDANGHMVFPLPGWVEGSGIGITCQKDDLRSFQIIDANDPCTSDGDVDDCPRKTSLQPGDEIMVLLRP